MDNYTGTYRYSRNDRVTMHNNTVKLIILSLIVLSAVLVFSCSSEKDFPNPLLIEQLKSMTPPAKAFNPVPADRSENVFRSVILSWESARMSGDTLAPADSFLYDVYVNLDSTFGINNLISEAQEDTFYTLENPLLPNRQYYWKIDIRDKNGDWSIGDVWKFKTGLLSDNLPEINITEPANESEFIIFQSVSFKCTADDIEDGPLFGSSVTWTSDIDGQIGVDTLFSTTNLSGGNHLIIVTAQDSKDGIASDSVRITVTDTTSASNTPPDVQIDSPPDGSPFIEGSEITFTGTVTDQHDITIPETNIIWSSNVDGELGTGSEITVSTLSLGNHTINLSATDSESLTGTAEISVAITPSNGGNTSPAAVINSPADQSQFTAGTQVMFSGTGTDLHDGDMFGSALIWISDIDDTLGYGKQLTVSNLSTGIHTVKLIAKDSGGLEGTDSVFVRIASAVNTAPKPRLKVTQDLSNYIDGLVKVTLDATLVYDAEDPSGNIEVRWDLDNNGNWDTAYTLTQTYNFQYTAATKPRFIRMQVRDAGGLTGEMTAVVPEMVRIPAGTFNLGAGTGAAEEQPIHTVMLSEYFMGRYEVMNWQFATFLSENGNDQYYSSEMSIVRLSDGSFIAENGRENFPVTHVDWASANAYAEWYNKKLPTEAQWEKAARGPAVGNVMPVRDFPWGYGITSAYANYLVNPRPYNGLAPVGTYTGDVVNSIQTVLNSGFYGCFDLIGNVSEWTNDYFQANYYSVSPSIDPPGPASGTHRVHRGGSYETPVDQLRNTRRFTTLPTARPYHVGFRCVINP